MTKSIKRLQAVKLDHLFKVEVKYTEQGIKAEVLISDENTEEWIYFTSPVDLWRAVDCVRRLWNAREAAAERDMLPSTEEAHELVAAKLGVDGLSFRKPTA